MEFKIKFPVYSGCGQFREFKEDHFGYTRQIKIMTEYKGCACTAEIPIRETTYWFKPMRKGTYYLKFNKGNGETLVDTVVIN